MIRDYIVLVLRNLVSMIQVNVFLHKATKEIEIVSYMTVGVQKRKGKTAGGLKEYLIGWLRFRRITHITLQNKPV